MEAGVGVCLKYYLLLFAGLWGGKTCCRIYSVRCGGKGTGECFYVGRNGAISCAELSGTEIDCFSA